MDASFTGLRPGPRNLITDVDGLAVGNAEDTTVRTGTTVLLCDPRAVAAVDVRGGAPGTRETDALDPACLVDRVDALVLSGGSVYGLDAASEVTAWLGARERGFEIPHAPVRAPIVPSAILFDLANGGDKGWGETPPYRALARMACETAAFAFDLGNTGAGYGALSGDLKGGLGSASITAENGLVVGALAAVNAFGSVRVPGTDLFWAAPFEIGDEFGGRGVAAAAAVTTADPFAGCKSGVRIATGSNTTLATVATNADLTRGEAQRVAMMAQDGLARAIRPVHTTGDGDTVFALAAGGWELPEPRSVTVSTIGALAADTLARAIARAIYEAASLGDVVAYRDRSERS